MGLINEQSTELSASLGPNFWERQSIMLPLYYFLYVHNTYFFYKKNNDTLDVVPDRFAKKIPLIHCFCTFPIKYLLCNNMIVLLSFEDIVSKPASHSSTDLAKIQISHMKLSFVIVTVSIFIYSY